nr:HipA domain-containing protein [Thiocystis violacea]
MGALRLSRAEAPGTFLSPTTDVPKLVHLQALEAAIERLEHGDQTDADLALLAQPGSSLGGAHPKAAIEDQGKLYIAKFQSRLDTERIGAWEATMLDLARTAGLRVAKHRLLNADGERPVLLVERFDRQQEGRLPFASAMTLAARDEQTADTASYLELADVIKATSTQPKLDLVELWRRMTFNAVCGNTDDHLRNHGFLRKPQGWRLSPAYDLNPDRQDLERRRHALSFDGEQRRPSLQLCLDLADYFGVNTAMQTHALGALRKALESWQDLAKRNGLRGDEIKRMAGAFSHAAAEQVLERTAARTRSRSR